MDEQITLDEVYKLLGERDMLIYRLQQQIIKLSAAQNVQIPHESVRKNGEDVRETLK